MGDPEPSSLLGTIVAFFALGAICGACGVHIYSDPMSMRNMYREQMWQEAVANGVAEKLETSQGAGYRWKWQADTK